MSDRRVAWLQRHRGLLLPRSLGKPHVQLRISQHGIGGMELDAASASGMSVPRVPHLAWLCPGRLSLQPTSCTSLAPLRRSIIHHSCSGSLTGRHKTQAPSTAAALSEARLSSLSPCPSGRSSVSKSVTSGKHPPRETSTSPLFPFRLISLPTRDFPAAHAALCLQLPCSTSGAAALLRRAGTRGSLTCRAPTPPRLRPSSGCPRRGGPAPGQR